MADSQTGQQEQSLTVENDVAHLAAGKTPINCSNGLKGRPIVNAMS
jgi:hypothetical protein